MWIEGYIENMDKRDYGYYHSNPLNEVTPQDIYNCFAVGFRIISDYLEYVVATGEYKEGELALTPPQLIGANLLGAYCKFIGRLIQLKELNLQTPTIDNLQSFLERINHFDRKLANPRLNPNILDEPRAVKILLDEFDKFSKDIHTVVPTYKGMPYEHTHIIPFFQNLI